MTQPNWQQLANDTNFQVRNLINGKISEATGTLS